LSYAQKSKYYNVASIPIMSGRSSGKKLEDCDCLFNFIEDIKC
jgi:hypothetical protein